MSKVRIKTYEDLEAERKRLQNKVDYHKQQIRETVGEIKKEFSPLVHAYSFMRDLFTPGARNPLIDLGANLMVDGPIKLLLSRAGWITRLVAPFFLKGISKNLLLKYGGTWLEKIMHFIKKDKVE